VGVDSVWEQKKLEATRTRNARREAPQRSVHAVLGNIIF
jgi:hypothetical protein